MSNMEDIAYQLRINRASNHSYNWRQAARNLLMILFASAVCMLAFYGLYSLAVNGIEAIKK